MRGQVAGTGECSVHVDAGRIASVGRNGGSASGRRLSPGFIDIQLNGFHGVDFSGDDLTPEQCIAALPWIWKTGCTSFCATLVTNTIEKQARNFRVMEQARAQDKRFAATVVCYHQEGPYISGGPSHGAHDPALTKAPDWDEFCRLQEAANGLIGIVTLAPEWPGAPEFIRKAVDSGVIVSIGHTDGTAETVRLAADAGATLSTHLGNGCPQMIHRHRYPIWAQLDDERLMVSLIPDGFHLPPELLRVVTRVKSLERCIVITDAVHVAGLPPGRYSLNNSPVDLDEQGKVTAHRGGGLGGSSVSMNDAIWRFASMSGISLDKAVDCATRVPAGLLSRYPLCSSISEGQPANLVTWHDTGSAIEVDEVMVAGEIVYSAGAC